MGLGDEGGGAFGEAMGHDKPSAGEDFCGGNGVVEAGEEALCMGHPGC